MNAALVQMFRYNAWANRKLLAACAGLTQEQLAAPVPAMEWSLQKILAHMIAGQHVFLLRLSNGSREQIHDVGTWEYNAANAWPGHGAIAERTEAGNAGLIAEAEATADEDTMCRLPSWQGKPFQAARSFLLVHAMEHGVEHRTQIVAALQQIGVAAPDLDAWSYSADTSGLVVEG